ncbi:colicin immunity domain-containing protein [Anthocerotibacter panamensis]|uniref:colicin immunity domain-containing protein n=1 Tax=Anthocerotibacter panamensis TaxID=2857077 RepID=UPI001C40648E|nr:colicin immunity domain-containing protein [Anthocerotibacter panamensis]
MSPLTLETYSNLIGLFLDRAIDVHEFEKNYLNLFKEDSNQWSVEVYSILNDLFSDIDAFCGDPDLLETEDLSEDDLRLRCTLAFNKLKAI